MHRPATLEDIPALLEIGRKFAAYYPIDAEFCADRTSMMLRGLIESSSGAVIVAVAADGSIAGGIVGAVTPLWFSTISVATELALWVEPGHRCSTLARELMQAFERWAEDQDVSAITMSDLSIGGEFPFGNLLRRVGYTVVERSHFKGV